MTSVLGCAQGRSSDAWVDWDQTGEQWTMFRYDPAGNAVEFKAFPDDSQVFAA
jgi:extradiol dioxygenase family protein